MGYGLGSANAGTKAEMRTVVLASADAAFRARLRQQLAAMRWSVREASGGAEAMAQLEAQAAEAMVLDSALPDLEVSEFASEMRRRYPVMDLLRVDARAEETGARSPRRNELLHAMRQTQGEGGGGGADDRSGWRAGPLSALRTPASAGRATMVDRLAPGGERGLAALEVAELLRSRVGRPGEAEVEERKVECLPLLPWPADAADVDAVQRMVAPLPEMVGGSAGMIELARMIRLVAPRTATVLIEGATGTGKELVAKAVHRLSKRASKPFLVLNCAAIPEALLEAELFGHTRGAFTGAVQSRTGRIEAANGGTLFLDEIGEMPLALQAKMLRFLESGELQRVGDNETLRVDVRVVAASHQPLQKRAAEGTFRLDLYHRLAVFPVLVPALKDRMEDLLPLADYLLGRLGEEMPIKRLSREAAVKLMQHDWPGNVRELAHVLERGAILAEDRPEITPREIRF